MSDQTRQLIETAVIPAAGRGTRMMPLTAAVPKEMFPLGHIPLIEHTISELTASGIKKVCIVITKGKEIIREYLKRRAKFYKTTDLHFAYQKEPLGLGDALRAAASLIGSKPFVMAIPDQLLLSDKPATRQLIDASGVVPGVWSSMVQISEKEITFFRGSRPVKCRKEERNLYIIEDFLDDEKISLRGFGRTVFPNEALKYMTMNFKSDETGEIDLLKTFKVLKKKFNLYGVVLDGIPCDFGTWEGYDHYRRVALEHLRTGN